MTGESLYGFFAGTALGLIAIAAPPVVSAHHAIFDPDSVLRSFHERVEGYAALHRRLAPPPLTIDAADPLSGLLTGRYLAAAIRTSRPHAQQGEIFTPEAARLFRWMLADLIGELDGEEFLAGLNDGVPAPRGEHPVVNEGYPMVALHRLPSNVRRGLPVIPPELDYRVAGHDLVLWDIYAGVVIDFVPDALVSGDATE